MTNSIPPEYNIVNENTYSKYTVGKFFEQYVLQPQYYPYQFDGWGKQKNYGLVDDSGIAVYPKDTSLKIYLDDSGREQKNLFFVQEAFEDLRAYHVKLLQNNKFNKDIPTVFINLNPVSSTEYFDDLYTNYLQNILSVYKDTFLVGANFTDIKNIHDFSRALIRFFDIFLTFGVINRSTFATSRFCNQNINGLTISFLDRKIFTDYDTKANQFFDDQNFKIFYESAQRYGFYVDRNLPWRIVADLGSPILLSYSQKYGYYNTKQIFRNLYYYPHLVDLQNLRNIIIAYWNVFVNKNQSKLTIKDIPNCSSQLFQIDINKQITINLFDKHFSKNWLIRLYLYTKFLEYNIRASQALFDNLNKECDKIYEYYGEQKLMDFVDSKIRELRINLADEKQQLTDPDILVKLLQQTQAKAIGQIIF